MTRIISGRAGGIVLDVPGSGTRPTSDRVRESLFSALESADAVAGARVLDLYAGSGALGLEALSRGAGAVDLVERAAVAAATVQRNAARVTKALGRHGAVRVHRAQVSVYLARPTGPYDLVLLDPPYDLAEAELAANLEALHPRLSVAAWVIIERAKRSPAPQWRTAGFEAIRDRNYGDTTMWWGQPRPESQSR